MLRTRTARKRKKYWQQEEPNVVAHLNEAVDALLAGGWGWRNIIKINTTTINNNNTGSTNKNTSTIQHANKKQAPSNKQQQQQK